MKKVFCIKEFKQGAPSLISGKPYFGPVPVVDEPYTVKGTFLFCGKTYLFLMEIPGNVAWNEDSFAELPDSLDEDIKQALKAPIPCKVFVIKTPAEFEKMIEYGRVYLPKKPWLK